MGVNLWHQYLKDFVNHPERVSSVADSSIFYDPVISLYPKEKAFEMIKSKVSPKLLNTQEDPNPVSYLVQLANVDERLPNKECSYLFEEEDVAVARQRLQRGRARPDAVSYGAAGGSGPG